MREKKTILIAMGNSTKQADIKELLARSYNVLITGTAKAATVILESRHPHLMLIDADLPGGSLALIRNLRKTYEAPIIVLSESAEEDAIVDALDAGANDVLVMPFGRPEHMARIRAALRFCSNILGGEFSAGGLKVNFAKRTVELNGEFVHLTPIEFRIMTMLTLNPGKVLTHEQIINEIWGPYNTDNLVLRVNIANIRRKIEANPAEPKYIITELGVGYRIINE